MSVSVYWKPVKPDDGKFAGKGELKYALESVFGRFPRLFDGSDLPYLVGMKAGGISGVDVLIKAIEKCGKIEVTFEY